MKNYLALERMKSTGARGNSERISLEERCSHLVEVYRWVSGLSQACFENDSFGRLKIVDAFQRNSAQQALNHSPSSYVSVFQPRLAFLEWEPQVNGAEPVNQHGQPFVAGAIESLPRVEFGHSSASPFSFVYSTAHNPDVTRFPAQRT